MPNDLLNSEEAALYLGIKERKLYELVGAGRLPGTKMTGKWLFPRHALDRWLESGLIIPPGYAPVQPPMIIAGSQDMLLDWAARRSGAGLALLAEGSAAGLRHLERNEAAIAAIHLHRAGEDDANTQAVSASPLLADAVVISFAEREQGLLLRKDTDVRSFAEALEKGLRFGPRQAGAGAQLLLEKLMAEHAPTSTALPIAETIYATGEDLAFAVEKGEVDCGIATRAVAEKIGLHFVPLIWEAFDLVLRRRVYFKPALQRFFAFLRSEEFHDQAQNFGGYRTGRAGQVKFNR